jgi:hypothetical protein
MRKFHHQWFGDDKVFFAYIRRFGNVDEMCSPQLSERKHFVTNGLVTSMFCNVYMEIQAGMEFAQKFGLCVLRERSLMTNVITFGSLRTLQ